MGALRRCQGAGRDLHDARKPHDGPRGSKHGPKAVQDGPKTAQEGPKTAQETSKTAQEAPKTAPRGGPDGGSARIFRALDPRGPRETPRGPQRGRIGSHHWLAVPVVNFSTDGIYTRHYWIIYVCFMGRSSGKHWQGDWLACACARAFHRASKKCVHAR